MPTLRALLRLLFGQRHGETTAAASLPTSASAARTKQCKAERCLPCMRSLLRVGHVSSQSASRNDCSPILFPPVGFPLQLFEAERAHHKKRLVIALKNRKLVVAQHA